VTGSVAEPGTGPRTTVVIATRNRATELARTLAELHRLRPRPPIIVVDNASADRTPDQVARFPGVRLVRLPRNAAAAARNVGVALAATEYVAFSDDDSWWAPDALARAEQLLTGHPRIALLAARTLVGESERPDPVNALMADSPLGREADLPGPSVLGFLACAAVLRVSAFRQVGGFSPVLHFGAEERLLAYDLAAAGWALCYVDELCAHHHPSSARPPSSARRRLEQRNNALITWMRLPARVAVGAGIDLLRRAPSDPDSLAALAGALRRLPVALRLRRRLPPQVEQGVRLLREAEHPLGAEHPVGARHTDRTEHAGLEVTR
jgi:glycosyltransferase involved in cell wall biosynthesis